MSAPFLRPGARPMTRRAIIIEPKGLDYLAAFAARAIGSKPCAKPFPFLDHRTLAEVDAQRGEAS